MKRQIIVAGVILIFAAAILLINFEAGSQKPDEARMANVKQLMVGFQQPAMKAFLGSTIRRPATDKEWATIAMNAALLNEIGFLLIEAGRGKDEVWTKACADLRTASAKAVSAAMAKNIDKVKATSSEIALTCQACHDVHKK